MFNIQQYTLIICIDVIKVPVSLLFYNNKKIKFVSFDNVPVLFNNSITEIKTDYDKNND